jgi:hypothetical protein
LQATKKKTLKKETKPERHRQDADFCCNDYEDVARRSVVETAGSVTGAYCLRQEGDRPDDGGSKLYRNVGHLLPHYTV